jgi:cytochrome P450
MVFLPIWWINRSTLNWGADAADFRPERHLGAEGAGGPAEVTPSGVREGADDGASTGGGGGGKSASGFRMLAFSGGQRNCVGQRFAMLEATVLFAILLRSCTFEIPADAPPVVPVSAGIVQKPKDGIWMVVGARGPVKK